MSKRINIIVFTLCFLISCSMNSSSKKNTHTINDSSAQLNTNLVIHNNTEIDTIRNTAFVIDEQEQIIPEIQRKAFAEAEFGMSVKEVSKLPTFKNYLKYDNQIDGIREQIGNEKYDIFLLFGDNDALHTVVFTTMAYFDASFLKTSIKKQVENLKTVIETTYGAPSKNYGFPSIFEMNQGKITWAYIWTIGAKNIKIGVEEEYRGGKYRVYSNITNTKIASVNVKQKDNKAIEESAKMF